jgi:hypothetical protein
MSTVEPDRWEWARSGVQKDFAKAYGAFRAELRAVWPETVEHQLAEAYGKYVVVLQSAAPTPEGGLNALRAYEEYASRLQRALDENDARRRILDAFEHYVVVVREAWAGLNPAVVKPHDMAAICESMAWVSGLAASATPANPFGLTPS